MSSLIKIYNDALPNSLCNQLIEFFESQQAHHERFDGGRPSFTQLNFTDINSLHIEQHQELLNIAQGLHHRYLNEIRASYFPKRVEWEKFRIKRYHSNGIDQFAEHVDAADANSSKRCLAFIFYLNTVRAGGETIFSGEQRLAVTALQGRAVIFPPLWMFPHSGAKVISGSKYIVSTYLHFA